MTELPGQVPVPQAVLLRGVALYGLHVAAQDIRSQVPTMESTG